MSKPNFSKVMESYFKHTNQIDRNYLLKGGGGGNCRFDDLPIFLNVKIDEQCVYGQTEWTESDTGCEIKFVVIGFARKKP